MIARIAANGPRSSERGESARIAAANATERGGERQDRGGERQDRGGERQDRGGERQDAAAASVKNAAAASGRNESERNRNKQRHFNQEGAGCRGCRTWSAATSAPAAPAEQKQGRCAEAELIIRKRRFVPSGANGVFALQILHVIQPRISAVQCHQLVVRALLHDFARARSRRSDSRG